MFADKVNDIQTDIHNDMTEFLKTFTHIGDVHIIYALGYSFLIMFKKNNNSSFLT